MGNGAPKPVYHTTHREITECYLNSNPEFLTEYTFRNEHLLDQFVHDKVTKERICGWSQQKKQQKPDKPVTPDSHLEYAGFDYKKSVNTTAQHTNLYQNKDLVVRRSASFNFDLKFKTRSFDATKDSVAIEFAIGPKPSAADHTLLSLAAGKAVSKTDWSCALTSNNTSAKSVSLQVFIPSNALIGRYKVTAVVTSKTSSGDKPRRYILADVLVIFNPFSADDAVYMADEKNRNEYVLNEQGLIWAGSTTSYGKVKWNYGQFEKDILDIALRLLDQDKRAKTDPVKCLKQRNNPVYCSRILSAMVNENDDKGVLIGRWDGNYNDGVKPTSWNGSTKILRSWSKHNKGVKYGQCWVFSGVFTTVLRALGIPARSLTTFNSAHDTDSNMSIDKFYYSDGTQSSTVKTNDSVWNFHVWNDAWMKRPDLGKGYDGWQSVDATPQEKSSGIYQCGPAPLTAVKNGEVNLSYDTGFVFGEVNADVCKFLLNDKDQIIKIIGKQTRHIGQLISTKTPGSNARLDITDEYKYKEGTPQERAAFDKAQLRGKIPAWHSKYLVQPEGAIDITITPKEKKFRTGKPISFTVKVTNGSKEVKECKVTNRLDSLFYTGKRKSGIKQETKDVTLKPSESTEITVNAEFKEYSFALTPIGVIQCVTSVRVTKTNDLYIDSTKVRVKHPKFVTITHPETEKPATTTTPSKTTDETTVKYSIKNPFPFVLSSGRITLDGTGIDGSHVFTKAIGVNETVTGSIKVKAARKGKILVLGNFDSDEISSAKCKVVANVK